MLETERKTTDGCCQIIHCIINTLNSAGVNRWMLSLSSILNEIVKDSIEALHYCEIDVKIVKSV